MCIFTRRKGLNLLQESSDHHKQVGLLGGQRRKRECQSQGPWTHVPSLNAHSLKHSAQLYLKTFPEKQKEQQGVFLLSSQ